VLKTKNGTKSFKRVVKGFFVYWYGKTKWNQIIYEGGKGGYCILVQKNKINGTRSFNRVVKGVFAYWY
jgi:hypothetical protein